MNQQTDRASSSTTHTITPHLVVGGAAQAADWYQQAFGAQVGAKIPVPGRQVHPDRGALGRRHGDAGR